MILKKLYEHFLTGVKTVYGTDEAANITAIIFEWAAGIRRSDVLMKPDMMLDAATILKIEDALASLRTNKPVQYVTGEAWFYKLLFYVSPAVLIPRPETEELVEAVLDFIKDKPVKIIDIGAGSGCISIAIAKNAVTAALTATDISTDALQIAKKNAANHHVSIDFIEADFLNADTWHLFTGYDVIVSNPPYIPLQEEKIMDKNVVAYEPAIALFVPDDKPYIFYECIAIFAKTALKEGGKIFTEIHEEHAQQVAAIFSAEGFVAEIKKDISGKERMVMATRSR